MKLVKIIAVSTIFLAVLASSALAGYSKDYIPAPAGTNGLLYYGIRATGNELKVDGDTASRDVNLKTEISMLRFVQYFETKGVPWNYNILVPFGNVSLDTDTTSDSVSQYGDPAFILTVWPYSDMKNKTHFGFSTYVFFPFGEYDKRMPVNIGSNRWSLMLEPALEKGIADTNFTISAYANVTFFQDNDDANVASDTLEKKPYFTTELHGSYDWTKTFYTSVDYLGEYGGETTLDNVNQEDKANNQSVGGTMGIMFNPNTQFLLNYMYKVKQENGIKSNSINFRLGYFF